MLKKSIGLHGIKIVLKENQHLNLITKQMFVFFILLSLRFPGILW